jgi:transcriptional regulator with XRE-family HTH domain
MQLLFSNKVLRLVWFFDFDAFYRALAATVASRGVSWKKVSEETGVSQTTLSRMSKGRQPDSESLTSLAAWSGLNPVDFTRGEKRTPEPMALVGKLLREDPNLDANGADALEAILKAAYERFKLSTG